MLSRILLLLTLVAATQTHLLMVYSGRNLERENRTITGPMPKLAEIGFTNRISSAEAIEGDWEMYVENWYDGRRFVITEGQILNSITAAASFLFQKSHGNNKLNSVRPICKYTKDPERAKLIAFDAQGRSKEFFVDAENLGEWDDRIVEVLAEAGDWELYQHAHFSGKRNVVRDGAGRVGLGADASSLRPVCKGKFLKERCRLTRVEVPETSLIEISPKYNHTTVVELVTDASCTIRDRGILEVGNIEPLTEIVRVATNGPLMEDEINWYLSKELEIDAPYRFTDSDLPVKARVLDGVALGRGHDHIFKSKVPKTFFPDSEAMTINSIEFTPPGAALILVAIDRYSVPLTLVDVILHLDCNGETRTIPSKMKFNSEIYPRAHVLGLHGTTDQKVCFSRDPVVSCMQMLHDMYQDYSGKDGVQVIRDEFQKCVDMGNGMISVVQSDTYEW